MILPHPLPPASRFLETKRRTTHTNIKEPHQHHSTLGLSDDQLGGQDRQTMCKQADQNRTGGGMFARMRHLQGPKGENSAQALGASGSPAGARGDGSDEEGETGGANALPPLPPVLRLLSPDVFTEACTLLDVKSLATAAAVCRSFRDACHDPYPWKRLCSREWALPTTPEEGEEEEEEEEEGKGTRRIKDVARRAATAPRGRLQFRDSILGSDFRKLFPLIEQMPTGFDCSLLRGTSNEDEDVVANNGDGEGQHDGEGDDGNQQDEEVQGEGEEAAAPAPAPAAPAVVGGEVNAGDGAGDADNNQAGAPPPRSAAEGGGGGGGAAGARVDDDEEKAGDFLIRGVKRRPMKQSSSSPPGLTRASTFAPAAAAAPEADVGAAATPEGRPRSSSGDVALQVEFRGGLGVGNRCVRADLPLPSTLLRERTGAGARSSVAQQPDMSPLALFRWLLAKMASTAGGSSGGSGVGGGSGESQPPLPPPRFFTNLVIHHDNSQPPPQAGSGGEQGVGVGEGQSHHNNHGSDGTLGERRERASSLPSVGGGRRSGGGGGLKHHDNNPPLLPRVLCFPVALESGLVDVTPRLVSYFEVTIMTPRVDPPHAIPDCIAVGISESGFPLKGKMPGWDARSYGYHSDDGGAFHNAGSMLFKCGPAFGPGDVVGCGLDYSAGDDRADVFFTLNGEALNGGNPAFRGVRGTFYPTVGVDSACPVRINLGAEPFRFDLTAALRAGGQEATARESVAQHEPKHSKAQAGRGTAVTAAAAATAAAGDAPSRALAGAGARVRAAGVNPPPLSFSKRMLESSSGQLGRTRQRSLPSPDTDTVTAAGSGGVNSGGSRRGNSNNSADPNVALSY